MKNIKISFCIIVCNGDDFIYECLESIYPHAHSICISEGATENWMNVHGWENPRSKDATIELIKKFKQELDVDNKLQCVIKPNPYKNKLDQCNTYIDIIPPDTDYLWVIDSDELYLDDDVNNMKNILLENNYDYVEVFMDHFFKNINTIAIGGDGWGWNTPIGRIWKYSSGAQWQSHRPMTLITKDGQNINKMNILHANQHNIRCKHYSYMTDKQVKEKMMYYTKTFNIDYINGWYKHVWLKWNINPSYVESKYSTHPSCGGGKTKSYNGIHPNVILKKFGIV